MTARDGVEPHKFVGVDGAQYRPRGTHRDHTATETALVAATGLRGPRRLLPGARLLIGASGARTDHLLIPGGSEAVTARRLVMSGQPTPR